MSKKILISLSVIGAVAAIVVGGTIAYFSDTETSTGNIFTAGTLDLQIDSTCHYYQNGEPVDCKDASDASFGDWDLTDLQDGVRKFFAFNDVKPGDWGEDTISLHVFDNPAWACVQLGPLTNDDNGCNEPESDVDSTCGAGEGELGDNLYFTVWADVCDGGENEGEPCDNVYQSGCDVLLTSGPANGDPLNGTVWPIADSNGNVFVAGAPAPLDASTKYCLGIKWEVPAEVGNIIQSDSVSGDVTFYVEQSRNNPNFTCGQPIPVQKTMNLENKDTEWNVFSGDNIDGTIVYFSNADTFYGTVSGRGLTPDSPYQITLNGPGDCTLTDDGLAGAGANAFESGYWNGGPNLDPTTCDNPGEGVLNMDLTGTEDSPYWYTVWTDAIGNFSHNFSFNLPAGDYSGVKVLVKRMEDPFESPWAYLGAEYAKSNLYETAPISFTIVH